MRNIEKHKDELLSIARYGQFAVKDGMPIECFSMRCSECEFLHENDEQTCEMRRIEWLCEEYKEPKIQIPSDIPIDTKVLVSDDGINWERRYYAGYKDGEYYAWDIGLTSWTIYDDYRRNSWNYMRLADGVTE